MQKLHLLTFFLIVSFFLGGCDLLPFGGETEPDDEITETTTPAPENDDEDDEVTEIERPVANVRGLQGATDPEDFVRERGESPGEQRQDPFAFFPVSPENVTRAQPEEQPAEEPEEQPAEETVEEPVEEIKPELAQAVEVQGAVRIGNETKIIVKAPNEPTSRHVRTGELIAQDQVLVKDINIDARPNPIVVLEELGVGEEVVKEITGEFS
ncbi:hypothetical protein FRE64_13075 [Euhalothece natronophila Z-M001]|uniref:Uncharacterized protein n=1 Tax=Euhalothece natronophila Z-M001 TaxID=522448 RepID=A0A5B8NR75_9CHRO|nr:hypothetical protein [Euhalothece natronophila]QDZ40789.1 hypothetical protein FRE64_13075 [Euhalothece natronophila Z-M001]